MRRLMGLILSLMAAASASPALAAMPQGWERHAVRDAIRESVRASLHPGWGGGLDTQGLIGPGFALTLVACMIAILAAQALQRQRLETERLRGEAARLQEALRHAHLAPEAHPAPILAVRVRHGQRLVDPAEIDLIRAADDYCELVLSKGDRLLHAATLEGLAKELPASFRRVHRSAIVNVERIEALRRRPTGGYEILTRSGEVLPVGRAYLAVARAIMGRR